MSWHILSTCFHLIHQFSNSTGEINDTLLLFHWWKFILSFEDFQSHIFYLLCTTIQFLQRIQGFFSRFCITNLFKIINIHPWMNNEKVFVIFLDLVFKHNFLFVYYMATNWSYPFCTKSETWVAIAKSLWSHQSYWCLTIVFLKKIVLEERER